MHLLKGFTKERLEEKKIEKKLIINFTDSNKFKSIVRLNGNKSNKNSCTIRTRGRLSKSNSLKQINVMLNGQLIFIKLRQNRINRNHCQASTSF